jgi:hypothetical protein
LKRYRGPRPAEAPGGARRGRAVGRPKDLSHGGHDELTVEQADCDHVGNSRVGRDRIFVTWQNLDGSTETDHFELRYCE